MRRTLAPLALLATLLAAACAAPATAPVTPGAARLTLDRATPPDTSGGATPQGGYVDPNI